MSATMPKASLTVTSGPRKGRAYPLPGEPLVIGRLKPSQIILPSSGVSREHVRLRPSEQGWVIEDLNSLNGTFVNGERLSAPQLLKHDDRIQIHDTLLTFAAAPGATANSLTGALAPAGSAPTGSAPGASSPTGGAPTSEVDSGLSDSAAGRGVADTSVVAALDVRVGDQARVEVNADVKLKAILEIIRTAGLAHGIDEALGDVLDRIFEIFPQADHGIVLLEENERLVARAIQHRNPGAADNTLGPTNHRVAMQALLTGRALLSAEADHTDQAETVFSMPLRAVMCAPLVPATAVRLGVLQLVTDDPQRQFAQRDLDLLASIALLVGQLVEYARRYERRGAELALRRSESRFRALVEKSWDSIAILDANGVVVYSTPGRSHVPESPPEENVGRHAFDRVHPDDKLRLDALYAELLSELGGSRSAEFRLANPVGAWNWFEATATNLLHDPDVRGVVCNYRDITSRKQMEAQRQQLLEEERRARAEAERLSHMKDDFLATLSHELRTPLNAIVGWAELLQSGKLSGAEASQGIETIQRNARMQTQIIEDLLDMSRIISGRIRLDIQPVDLERTALAAVATVRPAAQAKEISIDIDCHDCPPINGDPARLQQVFWNLLANAVKFTEPRGRVAMTAVGCADRVELWVSDSGEGIDPSFLPHVFERFRQADSSPARRHGGLGLGLAIVKQLVESHGGTIRAESAGRGQGSTFVVTLPRAFSADKVPSGPASHAPIEHSENSLLNVEVLVVDDERDSRELAVRILREAGAEVRSASSAEEALKLFEQEPPAVLLADIAMPQIDGYELLRRVREMPDERARNVPAVAVTAFAHPEGRRQSKAAGFQVHLSKPLNRAELVRVVARLVANPTG